MIDDLHYISFPCPCNFSNADGTERFPEVENIRLFNVVVTKVRDSAMKKFRGLDGSTAGTCGSGWNDSWGNWNTLLDPRMDPISIAMGLRDEFKKR